MTSEREAFEKSCAEPWKKQRHGSDLWTEASNKRFPWFPKHVADEIHDWLLEARHADALKRAGESVQPILLTGETRCGKTSIMCKTAKFLGLKVFRLSISQIVTSYLGETAKALQLALSHAATYDGGASRAIWIVDEIDGVFQQRGAATSSAARELNVAVSAGLTMIESMPSRSLLVATSNEPSLIDKAILARFRQVDFPTWDSLGEEDRRAFAKSHGCEDAWSEESYARCVQEARRERIKRIIGSDGAELVALSG